jgi:hypothetical protein
VLNVYTYIFCASDLFQAFSMLISKFMRTASEKAREMEICFKIRSYEVAQVPSDLGNKCSNSLIYVMRFCANTSVAVCRSGKTCQERRF